MTKIPLGEILVNEGFISVQQLNEALKKKQEHPRLMIGDILVLMGYLTPDKLHVALRIQEDGKTAKSMVLSQKKTQDDDTSILNLAKTQNSIIELLIRKKIFTRDELMELLHQR